MLAAKPRNKWSRVSTMCRTIWRNHLAILSQVRRLKFEKQLGSYHRESTLISTCLTMEKRLARCTSRRRTKYTFCYRPFCITAWRLGMLRRDKYFYIYNLETMKHLVKCNYTSNRSFNQRTLEVQYSSFKNWAVNFDLWVQYIDVLRVKTFMVHSAAQTNLPLDFFILCTRMNKAPITMTSIGHNECTLSWVVLHGSFAYYYVRKLCNVIIGVLPAKMTKKITL